MKVLYYSTAIIAGFIGSMWILRALIEKVAI